MGTIRSTIIRAVVGTALVSGVMVLGATQANAAPNTWAAIAISVETGNIGYSYEQPSGAAAAPPSTGATRATARRRCA
jgi:hypothetical protein